MIFQKLFKNGESRTAADDSKSVTTQSSTSSGDSKGKGLSSWSLKHGKNKVSKKKDIVCETFIEEEKSVKVQTIEKLLNVYNNYTTPEDLLALFASENARVSFEDDYIPDITAKDLALSLQNLYKSFPDMKFTYKSISEDKETGKVILEGCRASGTHTGEPYSMVPGVFPAIPATGKHCINDEEDVEFRVKDGKIRSKKIIALGASTGIAGLYQQIGGSLVPPEKPASVTEEDDKETN